MADDIPVEETPQQGFMGQVNQGMNSFLGPINRKLESVTGATPLGGAPNLQQMIMQMLSAMRPGGGMMAPRMQPRIPNQPQSPPGSSDLILQMLQQRANPQGVLQSTRTANATAPDRFRPMSFDPRMEQAHRAPDILNNTQVLTPANRTPSQEYNLAVMRQMLSGGGQ